MVRVRHTNMHDEQIDWNHIPDERPATGDQLQQLKYGLEEQVGRHEAVGMISNAYVDIRTVVNQHTTDYEHKVAMILALAEMLDCLTGGDDDD
ncbi:MAG: hypothetical protein WCE53_04685 [Candidatus Acidiferrum sp.]